jgi:hypothetical protein
MSAQQPRDPRVWMPNDLMMLGVGPRTPPAAGGTEFYLMEDGTSYYLQEDGVGKFKLESSG